MSSLPSPFIERLRDLLGISEAELLVNSLLLDSITTVRLNPAKLSADELRQTLDVHGDAVPWCAEGIYLPERHPFTFDTDFHSGRYYVQDASSMMVAHVLRSLVREPVRCLDLCAAPGGKTTAALMALPSGSVMVSNEIIGSRARVLIENVVKWGTGRCFVTNNAPDDFAGMRHAFDVLLLDVPCSGEGMMRKDSEAVSQWSERLVHECAERQRRIVDAVWDTLRPGGLLVYSTCTFNREENEEIVSYILERYGAEGVSVDIESEWGIRPGIGITAPCYRFMPHHTRGEGLFMAVLRKPGGICTVLPLVAKPRQRKGKGGGDMAERTAIDACRSWLAGAETYDFIMTGEGTVTASPADELASSLLHCLRADRHIRLLLEGIDMAQVKGRNIIPRLDLALSTALRADAFSRCEVDYRTAIDFLQGNALHIDAPKGYVLITHRRAPLGFVNNLGNRANNLRPKNSRILSTHLPDREPRLIANGEGE